MRTDEGGWEGGVGPRRNRSRRSTSWPARYLSNSIRPQGLDLQKPTEYSLLNLWPFSFKIAGVMTQTFHLAFTFMLNFCHKFFTPSGKILPLSGAVAKSDFTPNFWPSNALTGLEKHERCVESWPRIVLDRCCCCGWSSIETANLSYPRRCLATSLIYSLSRLAPIVLPFFGNCLAGNGGSLYLFTFPAPPPPILSWGMCRKGGDMPPCMPIGISFSDLWDSWKSD